MPEIYNLLAKHFLNETSNNEEQSIDKFKKENPEEYQILKQLWKNGNIDVKDFDTAKAWNKVQKQVKRKNQTKVISLWTRLNKTAVAAAAVLLIGISALFVYSNMQVKMITKQLSANAEPIQIILPDSSVVWLNRNSTVTFPGKFKNNIRNIKLKGEVFFKVTRNPEKPFVINTQNAEITVLGTSFNIKNSNNTTRVDVTTGKVNVSNLNHTEQTTITAGLSAKVTNTQVKNFKNDNPNYLAWKTGDFIFENTTLIKAVDDLNSYYNNSFVIENTTNIPCSLTAKFHKAGIKEVLEILELTCNIKIVKKENKYIIKTE